MNSTMKTAIGIIAVAVLAMLFLHCGGIGAGNAKQVSTAGASGLNGTGSPDITGAGNASATGSADGGAGSGQVRTVKLSYNGVQYSPAEIRVKQGTRVRIEGDPATLRGCMLVVNIGGYDVSKAIRAGDNVIEFTADRAGTFPISCNRGIGDGTLIVESS